jgi:hypothetical protein
MSCLWKGEGGAIEGVLLPLRREGDFPLSNGVIDPNRRGKLFILDNIASPTSKSWSNVNKKSVGCP